MASKVEGEKFRDLICPMCLDLFKNATLLGCGHTFCKGCLEAYDEQHNDLDHIVCPVCRKDTHHGQDRVAGLTPNCSVKGIQDEVRLEAKDIPSNVCPLHKADYKRLLCEVCTEFICVTCFMDKHRGHKIMKKEEFESELKKTRDALIQKGLIRKTDIEKSVRNAEQELADMICHLSTVENKIKDTCTKKRTILQENEKRLLKQVDDTRKDLDKRLEYSIANNRKLIDNIDRSIKGLMGSMIEQFDSVKFKAHQVQCGDLENSLKKTNDKESNLKESLACVKQRVEGVQFCPADETLLALGHLEFGEKATSVASNVQQASLQGNIQQASMQGNIQHVQASMHSNIQQASVQSNIQQASVQSNIQQATIQSTAQQVSKGASASAKKRKRKKEKESLTNVASGIPPLLKSPLESMTVVRHILLPDDMVSMAAMSQDEVVIGYTSGSECFSLSGARRPHMKNDKVSGIAFLADGSSVVAHSGNTCCVYKEDSDGTLIRGMQYKCTKQEDIELISLCTDQHDNIYAVNSNPAIYIFHGSNPNPQKVVSTGSVTPLQIYLTKTGVMITTGFDFGSTVTVFDREGHRGSTIQAIDNNDHQYATVDSQDRVLVATLRDFSIAFRLARYTLQGTRLVKERMFKDITIHQIGSFFMPAWSTLVSLTPTMLAFAFDKQLLFIELRE